MIEFSLNGEVASSQSEGETPLLWVLREELKLTGTKFGCGIAQCGACTVHLDGNPARACVTPVQAVAGRSVTGGASLPSHHRGRARIDEAVPHRDCGCEAQRWVRMHRRRGGPWPWTSSRARDAPFILSTK